MVMKVAGKMKNVDELSKIKRVVSKCQIPLPILSTHEEDRTGKRD
jgi:hypothetical protein